MARLYPVGIQDFKEIRTGGYVYVDKTEQLHRLVRTGKYYFFGRPRRFGKSLMISTLESYFKYNSRKSLEDILDGYLTRWEEQYGRDPGGNSLSLRFGGVIRRAAKQTGQNVAILIDEYDKPLIQALGNEELQDEYRNILKAFYGNLKSCDGYIRFALLTGVTRFSRVSIFSDLNNLNDVTMDPQYATMCGITESELLPNFEEDIRELAQRQKISFEEACTLLKIFENWHNGRRSVLRKLVHSYAINLMDIILFPAVKESIILLVC